jgi:adenosylmethionine-8-amino-7-oxononanoate aminotransferase
VGHALSCAAALAVQQALESEGLLARVTGAGERLRAALLAAFGEHPHVGNIRGRGLLQAIELVADRETNAPFADELRLPARLKEAAMEEGLIVYPGGGPASAGYGPHILLAPPYIVEDRHIAEGVDKLGRVLAACLPAMESAR